MDGHKEEESDGLVQATFTIPCTSSSHLDQPNGGAFPILSEYECNARPSILRRRGFLAARKQAMRAYERTLSSTFDPVIDRVASFCANGQVGVSSFFLPGSSQGSTTRRLLVACLAGPQLSKFFYNRLKDRVQGQQRCKWVSLHPRECSTLAATVRLLVAQLMDGATVSDAAAVGLSSLGTLSPSTTVVIYLRSIALHKHVVLNDFLKAIHSAARAEGFPHIVVLLGAEGGLVSLDEKVDSESMRLMDVHKIDMPLPSVVFDTMTQDLFFTCDAQTSIWLGPSVLELLRYQYFERCFDLDKVLSTVELAIHHHFTTRPMTSIAALISSSDYDVADWKPVFFDRLRVHILDMDSQGQINLPRPADGTLSKQKYLQNILTDNDALLQSMQDFASASVLYRTKIRRAIRLLHALRSRFLSSESAEGEESMLGPRRTRIGGLAWHVLSGEDVNKQISAVVGAIKKASVRKLKEALAEQSSEWEREDAAFQQKLDALKKDIQLEMEKESEEEPEMEPDLSEEQRMEKVAKRLLREETSSAVKRSVADWVRAVIEYWANTRPILPQVWTYKYSSFLTQLTDPSPRGSILAALNDPSSSTTRFEDGDLPDVSQLYQQYQSAGKMINLYDMFQAFSQSVTATTSTKKRRLKGAEEDGMHNKDAIQTKFALAVHEMGKMGFLKKTRRKTDHVLKIVHDLPSSTTV